MYKDAKLPMIVNFQQAIVYANRFISTNYDLCTVYELEDTKYKTQKKLNILEEM